MDIEKLIHQLNDIRKRTSGESAEVIECTTEIVKKQRPREGFGIYCSSVHDQRPPRRSECEFLPHMFPNSRAHRVLPALWPASDLERH